MILVYDFSSTGDEVGLLHWVCFLSMYQWLQNVFYTVQKNYYFIPSMTNNLLLLLNAVFIAELSIVGCIHVLHVSVILNQCKNLSVYNTAKIIVWSMIVYPGWSICMPNLKSFYLQPFPRYGGSPKISKEVTWPLPDPLSPSFAFFVTIPVGPKILKAGHVTLSRSLWRNFAFLSLVLRVINLHAKFEVTSSNRSRDVEVPKILKICHVFSSRPSLT